MAYRVSNTVEPPRAKRAPVSQAPAHRAPLPPLQTDPGVSGVLSALPHGERVSSMSSAPEVGATGHIHQIPTLDGTGALPKLTAEPLANSRVSTDAPRPIGVDPSATGAFHTISSKHLAAASSSGSAAVPTSGSRMASPSRSSWQGGYGARRSRRMRGRRHPQVPSRQRRVRVSKGPLIVVSAVAALVTLVLAVILFEAFSAPATSAQPSSSERVEQTQTAPGEGILYDGYSYAAQQQEGGQWAFVRTSTSGSDPLVLFTFEGTPVEVVLYEGIFVVPENLNGSWDVVAWMMGGGSVPTQLMGQDGQPLGGEGQVSAASLNGSHLMLTLESGEEREVDLAV